MDCQRLSAAPSAAANVAAFIEYADNGAFVFLRYGGTRQGLALQEDKDLIIEMNKTEGGGEHASAEAQTSDSLVTISSRIQQDPAGIQQDPTGSSGHHRVPVTPSWRLICAADPKWLGRGEAFSAWGAGMGTVPCGLSLPSALSLVQMHI